MTTELITIDSVTNEIDKIVTECSPVLLGKLTKIKDAVALGTGINMLRELLEHPDIKKTILSFQDTQLGFMTDRSTGAVRKNPKLKPYTWETIRECVLIGMLNGYHFTGKEMYIIAGNFYAGKDGKRRKILDTPGLTDLKFTVSPPVYDSDGKFARCKCYASWKLHGEEFVLGKDEHADTTTFRLRVNTGMFDDGLMGKAASKLFTRIMDRIGYNPPEDIPDNTINAEFTSETVSEEVDHTDKFNEVFGEYVLAKGFQEYVSVVAEAAGMDLNSMMGEAIKNKDSFIAAFINWEKPDTDQDVLAPDVCPDNQGNRYTKAWCDKCEKRNGCPVWI